MPKFISGPTRIEAAGNKPKIIEEYIGKVNSKNADISIARMISPGGWEEPAQRPEFTEYTLVLRGVLQVETAHETFHVHAGEAICLYPGEWVRYSSPTEEGAEYVAVCTPAFSPETVNRES